MYREKPIVKETVQVGDAALTNDADLPARTDGESAGAASWAEGSPQQAASSPYISSPGVAPSGEANKDKPIVWLGKRLAIASIAFNSIFAYFAVHILAGHYFWRMTDIQATEYMYSSLEGSSIGVLICFVCYLRLNRTLAGLKENKFLTVCRALAGSLLIFGLSLNHGLFGFLAGLLACLGFIATGWLSRQIRQAVPSSFRFGRAVMWAGLASLPAALLSIGAIYSAIVSPSPANVITQYANHTNSELIRFIFLIWFLISVPTYALARNARTSEAKPLIALGLLQHTPLLLGITVQLAILSATTYALPMVASGAMALLTTAAMIAVGAASAAKVNGIKHRRKMKKAGTTLLD